VSNAVDSLDGKNGAVTVTTEKGKGIVRIAVSDTGKGMTKAELSSTAYYVASERDNDNGNVNRYSVLRYDLGQPAGDRGLARTVRADDHGHGPLLRLEPDAREHLGACVSRVDPLKPQHGPPPCRGTPR